MRESRLDFSVCHPLITLLHICQSESWFREAVHLDAAQLAELGRFLMPPLEVEDWDRRVRCKAKYMASSVGCDTSTLASALERLKLECVMRQLAE